MRQFPSKMFLKKCFQPHQLAANHLCNDSKTVCSCIFVLSKPGKNISCSKTGGTVSKSGITNVLCFPNVIRRGAEILLILNLNNFFSRHFKKSELSNVR